MIFKGDLEREHASARRQHQDVAPIVPWTPADGVPGAVRVGHSQPPHLADGMTAHVCIGDGAYSTIPNPQSYGHGGIVWHLTYATEGPYRLSAASIIGSFDYLLSDDITMEEATHRLALLRKARAALTIPATGHAATEGEGA